MTIQQTNEGATLARETAGLAVQVFPQSEVVPANILRWHFVFNRPVAVDRWIESVRLVDDQGDPVEHAFLDLPEGLWNTEGTVLTIMMHPGRIKSGVGVVGEGLTLGIGRTCSIVVNLAGFALEEDHLTREHVHSFTAATEVGSALSAEDWIVRLPQAGTFAPLEVEFGRLMDIMSVQASLRVVDEGGVPISADIAMQNDDKWVLIKPLQPWPAGKIAILPMHDLEDVTGQRLGDAFERKTPPALQLIQAIFSSDRVQPARGQIEGTLAK
jgi:hypothetical protein